jgi:mannose-1-phosphate guanylyltransferase
MTSAKPTIIPVILSGGSGTRLWPLSREASPKPFISLPDGESLLVKAFKRAALPGVTEMIVVTRDDLFFRTQDHFIDSDIDGVNISYLLEPYGKNTAAAVKLATLYAKKKFGEDVILLFLSADHLIGDQKGFERSVEDAVVLATLGHIVTFGITPLYPETGYGYIELGGGVEGTKGHLVARFTEKPDRSTALRFIESGRFLWNAGIFCFEAETYLNEARIVAPDIMLAAQAVFDATDLEVSPLRFHADSFSKLPDISIDLAMMERSEKVAVVPADFDWKDIGSWKSMSELTPENDEKNRTEGEVFTIDTRGTYINSPHRLTATIGIEDLIIVDTPDALLIAHKDRSQEVKKAKTSRSQFREEQIANLFSGGA